MDPIKAFRDNVAEVDRLVNFDREILQLVTLNIEELHNQLKQRFADERLNGGRALALVRTIRQNETVRSKYQAIYNQAIVLLVSHFASALGDLFREAVSARLIGSNLGKLGEEDFKLSLSEMKERDWNLQSAIPDLLIAKYDLTFQDMKTTVKAFTDYTHMTAVRDENMNNIITAQACRHVIVHAGGRITEKMIKQVSGAYPRSLKTKLELGEKISFTLEEIEIVKKSMIAFAEPLSIAANL